MKVPKILAISLLAIFVAAQGCVIAPLLVLGAVGALAGGAAMSYQGGEVVLGEFENNQTVPAETRDRIKLLKVVAVAQFAGETGGASGAVVRALQPVAKIKLIGPSEFRKKQEELGEGTRTPPSQTRQVDLARKVGEALKVDGVLIGSVEEVGVDRPGGRVEYHHKVTSRLVACSTGEILWWESLPYTVKVGTRVPTEEEAMDLVIPKMMDRFAALLKG